MKDGVLDPRSAVYLLVSLTKRCNMRCPSCFLALQAENFFQDQQLDFGRMREIVLHYKALGVPQVVPDAEGEVLLHREYGRIVSFINAQGFRHKPWLVTNAILLPRHAEFVVRNVREVLISVDGATAERYNGFRGGNRALFEKVKAGIRAIVRARNRNGGGPEIIINSVVTNDRCEEIPELIRFAEEQGVDTIKFTNFHATGATDRQPLRYRDGSFQRLLERVVRRTDYSVNILLPHVFGRIRLGGVEFGQDRAPFSCRMLRSIVIGSSGDFAPCCRIIPEAKWGNFFISSDKHNNESLRAFRRQFCEATTLEELPAICQECSHLSPRRLMFGTMTKAWHITELS